ncbi:MAG: cell wall metabolism sensor histidine kinase WalK [Elusimicrobiota bacterium]|nr:MAG: cell wall metabolism sensor histidine kinase WalK [Elusimicrobiota bacterium]
MSLAALAAALAAAAGWWLGRLSVRRKMDDLASSSRQLSSRLEETVSKLSRDRGRLAAVLDQMAEGVVAVDAAGRVILVNPALSRLLGIDPAAARGRGYIESLRHHGLAGLIGEVLSGAAPAAREIRLFAPEELVFDAHSAALTQDGRPAGALVVLHDITRLRRLEQVRRDFVANVSHELRTPLASIKGYAETLRDGALDDKKNRLGFVETIEEQAVHLTKLVDDLLDLSSIESGHRPPRLAEIELGPLLESAAKEAAPLAAERGVGVDVVSARATRASADADHVRQVLANLVSNAIKYSEKGARWSSRPPSSTPR